ncbi:putative tail fiber protein [Pseudomonas phage vB_PsyM_KIL2]|uniref:Putative tail fiber protein n=1 Tax=Pseudomonas phage vB_PsyM_KIL2 TaxID=1777066 RepID=A0A142IE28_9CAUD|nr:putative tail fiber protein [Pseudomonas phage vB_PsyM_KIL2]
MDLIKYDMTNIWAVAGDVVAPEVAKIRQGWGVEVVPRQWWNWFENRQDNNIAYILQKGIPEWDSTTEYIINKSYVQRNGITYKCTQTGTNSDPVSLVGWVKAFVESTPYLEKVKNTQLVNSSIPAINSSGDASYALYGEVGLQSLVASTQLQGRNAIQAQQASSNLSALSGVTASTNGLPYFTSTTAMGIATLTSFGRSFISANDSASARSLLGLGSSATLNVGTTANTVVAGDDSRITGAMQRGNNLADLLNIGSARANLGLGTAAVQNITTTPTDTTGGRLLKVGDFGIGAISGISVPDANAISATGVYAIQNNTTNLPSGVGAGGTIFNQIWDSNSSQQILMFGSKLWIRTKATSWGNWQEVYTTSNSNALASQVQASLQPALDLKINRSGDTMTGSLSVPSMEIGTSSQQGYLDFHSSGNNVDYDGRIISSGGNSSVGQGSITYIAAGGHYFTGLINGTATVAQSLTGNIGIGQVNSLQAQLDGKMSVSGGGNPAFSSSRFSGPWSGTGGQAGMQGLNVGWNSGEASGFSGEANFVCNRGSGTGGFTFRCINANNTSSGPVTTISYDGSMYVPGRLTSAGDVHVGGSFIDTSGNINGSMWGGYLSNYLSSFYLTIGNLANNIAQMGTGGIGTYAFLVNTSGSTVAAGQNLSSGLSYASTTSNGGASTDGGTWRAMGFGVNNGATLWLRVA